MDPYKILGISPNATDEEVKKAYKVLAKKYHPDMNVGAPNLPELERKFKEVQQAYDTIMDMRSGKSTTAQGSYGYGNSYGYGSQYQNSSSSSEDIGMKAAANYIRARRFKEALTALSGVSNRTAQWYYLSALANSGLGNTIQAKQHAAQAVQMEPNNADYIFLRDQLERGGQAYRQHSAGYGRSFSSPGTGNLCLDLILLNLLCNCCCCGSRRF